MAVSVTCLGARRAGGKGYVRFSDGTEMEFDSVADVRREVRQYANGEATEFLKMLMLAKWLDANPNLNNPALIANRTLTIDLSLAANLVRLT